MKPDYKNWIPSGMLFSLIAGTVLSLALLLVFGIGVTSVCRSDSETCLTETHADSNRRRILQLLHYMKQKRRSSYRSTADTSFSV